MHSTITQGDCLDALKAQAGGSVDLVITSPPYAERRKSTYGGIPTGQYAEWFLARSAQFQRVLKPTGSFVLNIKEHCEDGQRSLYVAKLLIALVEEQNWRLVDEFIWHKPNPTPGKWNGRLKDGWEHCFHLTRAKGHKFNADAVRKPMGDWVKDEMKKNRKEQGWKPSSSKSGFGFDHRRLCEDIKQRVEKSTGSGFGFDYEAFAASGVATALPSNVLTIANKLHKKDHPATFPPELPEFFIKLLTDEGDLVLDPFMGSGTALAVASRLGRRFVGIDVSESYVKLAADLIGEAPML